MLIEAQANLEVADNVAGHTPLHVAVSSGFTQGVELLIRAKANIEAKAKLDFKARDTSPQDPGNTPLHIAVWLGFTQVVEMLIEAKAPDPSWCWQQSGEREIRVEARRRTTH